MLFPSFKSFSFLIPYHSSITRPVNPSSSSKKQQFHRFDVVRDLIWLCTSNNWLSRKYFHLQTIIIHSITKIDSGFHIPMFDVLCSIRCSSPFKCSVLLFRLSQQPVLDIELYYRQNATVKCFDLFAFRLSRILWIQKSRLAREPGKFSRYTFIHSNNSLSRFLYPYA